MDSANKSREPVSAEPSGKLLNGRDKFASYSVIHLLGSGGMGEVYLMRNRAGENLAVKVMRAPKDGNIKEWRKRFAHEAEFAMNIRHPNLIAVHDVGEDPESGLCFIAMDYADGGSLADKIRKCGPMKIKDAVTVASQIATALEIAHNAGVIHRDIKPDNILFDSAGHAKLADLGTAKFSGFDGETTVTKTGMIIGTPAYMAPEQMMDSHGVDVRADIYSLGIVLYEMLTGVRPHADSTIVELLAKAVNGEELPDIRTVRPETSAALAYVIAIMVSPKPEVRPGSAEDVAKLFNDIDAGRIKVPKEFRHNRTLMERSRRRRRKFIVAFSAVSLPASLALGLVWFVKHIPKPPPEKITIVEKSVVTNMPREVRVSLGPEMLRYYRRICREKEKGSGKKLAKGCLYFGNIKLEDRKDAKGVSAWAYKVSEDGTFAGATCVTDPRQATRTNVVFECHGYERLSVPLPEGTNNWDDEFAVNLGTLTMKKIAMPAEHSLAAEVLLPEGVKFADVHVRMKNKMPASLLWEHAHQLSSGADILTTRIENGNGFKLEGCVPQAKYIVRISGIGCTDYDSEFAFPENGTLDLGRIQLMPVQEAMFAIQAPENGDDWTYRKVLLNGKDRLILRDTITNAVKVVLEQCRGENAVRVSCNIPGAKCCDLGAMTPEDFIRLERDGNGPTMQSADEKQRELDCSNLRPGHIYVIKEAYRQGYSPIVVAFVSLGKPAFIESMDLHTRVVPISEAPNFLRDSLANHDDMRMKFKGGRIVFGKLELEGQGGIANTAAIVYLNPDGTFSDFMGDNLKSVVFDCHGYARLEIPVPDAQEPTNKNTAIDLGTVRMRKLNPDEAITLEFKPILPSGKTMAEVLIEMAKENPLGYGRAHRDRERVVVAKRSAQSGESVRLSGCPPLSTYIITVKADGCATYTREVDLSQIGGTCDIGEMQLEVAKEAIMSFFDSKSGTWIKTAMLMGGDGFVDFASAETNPKRPTEKQTPTGRMTFSVLRESNGKDVFLGEYSEGYFTLFDIGPVTHRELEIMHRFNAKPKGQEASRVFGKNSVINRDRILGYRLEAGHGYRVKSSRADLEDEYFIIEYPATVGKCGDREPANPSGGEVFSVRTDGFVWSYIIEDGKAVLCHGTDKNRPHPCVSPAPYGKLVIPEKLAGHDVVALGSHAFYGCNGISFVVLPKTLERIDDYAFMGCTALLSISLPPNVKSIGRRAFNNCKWLKSVLLNNCTHIERGNEVFLHCPSLTRYSVSSSNNAFRVAAGTLLSRDGNTLIADPPKKGFQDRLTGDKRIIETTQDGRTSKFDMGSKTARATLPAELTMTIPDSSQIMELGPFALCDGCMVSCTMPKTLRTIGEGAFMRCKRLKTLIFLGDAPTIDNEDVPIFKDASPDLRIEVSRGSKGWNGPGSTDLPQTWPVGAGSDARPISYSQASKYKEGESE